MPENEQGFKVTDRRMFRPDDQGDVIENEQPGDTGAQAAQPAQPAPTGETAAEDACQGELDSGQYRNLPPVEFGSFIISLTHAAMLHLGHLEDPNGNKVERNLDLARHTIDTLAMLKEKTKGNLSTEDQSLLDGILTELRMLFVQTCKNK